MLLTTVFVGNLSPDVSESDLRAAFEPYGRITSLRLVARRRLAYIELAPEAAHAAVDALRGAQLKGRTVDVALEESSGGRHSRRSGRGRR
jgi:RNA recognition motif-containing protein